MTSQQIFESSLMAEFGTLPEKRSSDNPPIFFAKIDSTLVEFDGTIWSVYSERGVSQALSLKEAVKNLSYKSFDL